MLESVIRACYTDSFTIFQEEVESIDWDELDQKLISSLGSPENETNGTTEAPDYSCDVDTINDFIDLYESCIDGFTSRSAHEGRVVN